MNRKPHLLRLPGELHSFNNMQKVPGYVRILTEAVSNRTVIKSTVLNYDADLPKQRMMSCLEY